LEREPLSVALVIDQLTFDRMGPVISHLTIGLLDSIDRLTLITPAREAEELSLGPVNVIPYRRRPWPFRRGGFDRLLEQFGEVTPNVIHAFSHRAGPLARNLADELDRPMVLHLLSTTDVDRAGQYAPATMIAASGPLHDAAVHAAHDTPVELIRPGLLSATFPSCFSRPGLSPSILCMSAFEPETGVENLIHAARKLVDHGEDFMLLLLGDGPDEHRLRKLVEKLSLLKHVTFGRRMTDWQMIMSTADLFVVPGLVDRVDVRLLQAMAAGVAPVCCEMPNSDFVVDGETGIRCERQAGDALAAAILGLLRDRDNARKIARHALEHCRKHHSLSVMAELTAALYRTLAGAGPEAQPVSMP
jgi:glycosyltransferase involved in cell wall biosynthesis